MIFETHAHYEDEKFDADRDELLRGMREHGIEYVINVGSDLLTSEKSIKLAEQYPHVYAAVGVHPSDLGCLDEDGMDWLTVQCRNPKVAAVGEIGLDYYWDKEPAVQENQRIWFARQMQVAEMQNLPVIIHSRDAAEDTLQLMKELHAENIPGVIHCYSYSVEMAQEFLKMGYYIGIGGVLTFKNAKKLKEVAKMLPLDRILLETDCPYMAPEPHRGERNCSYYIPHVVSVLSQIKEIPEEEIIEQTNRNAKTLFKKVQ
ncbi:MAG: TatD family hydrolase [Lachnospiraceae bacterium]